MIQSIFKKIIFRLRILKYQWLSDALFCKGSPNRFQPILFVGAGKVNFGKRVQIGVVQAPGFWTTYGHIEARLKNSLITIENDVQISNGFSAIAFSEIYIGARTVIGEFCSIMDTDGHDIQPEKRTEKGVPKPIHIGENVFIGAHVIILKGVHIGNNAVIGAGAVITKNIPDFAVVVGSPQRIIKSLKS
jgi:galactoside O-acetyltransferase